MEGSKDRRQDFAHLKELIEDIKVGMLTTTDSDGTLRSRPLQTVGVEEDGTLWFVTSERMALAEAGAGRRSVEPPC